MAVGLGHLRLLGDFCVSVAAVLGVFGVYIPTIY